MERRREAFWAYQRRLGEMVRKQKTRLRIDTVDETSGLSYDPDLVERAFFAWERRNFAGMPPLPEEVAAIPPKWWDSLMTFSAWWQFQEDGQEE